MGQCFVGIDIGSVALKAVMIRREGESVPIPKRFEGPTLCGSWGLWFGPYMRTHGKPFEAASVLIDQVRETVGEDLHGIRLTGSASAPLALCWELPQENEFIALAKGVSLLHQTVRTVFEMGGEASKYLRLEPVFDAAELAVIDYDTNGDCAAGTGSFIDQQAGRLGFEIEQIGGLAKAAQRIPKIAGRCSVFAKSDMIHAQQKGHSPEEVLAGLCEAVARNFKSAVTKSKQIVPPVLFVGGLSSNEAVVDALRDVFDLTDLELIVPPHGAWLGAVGAAMIESEASHHRVARKRVRSAPPFARSPRLSLENVVLLRDRVIPPDLPSPGDRRSAYLGIDVGSVSTNFAVTDDHGNVLWELYVRTRARPIEVVKDGLRQLAEELGDRIEIRAVGTTGSGRELIGHLIGADTINDEITAHRTGASFIAERYLESRVDTILEIGGQDSKYIRLEDGVVVDFTMNDACAAGTGSFLEERAVELGVSIKDEFADRALSASEPIRLGERCTVFMERDVFAFLRQGAELGDLVAGLAYSVVQNYINRVVRGRPIDGVVFFQGGTAYNDAVAAAFAAVLDREIVVPPHNGVLGAIGAAFLAQEWSIRSGARSGFRGCFIDAIRYSFREFTCKGCQNYCNMQEFSVEGEKSYWGDQCSDRYRKHQKTGRVPVIQDLFGHYLDLLPQHDIAQGGPTVGLPRSMYMLELLPFWHRFFESLGWSVIVSPPTTKGILDRGLESTVAEPCLPIQVAHGHVGWLLDRAVDAIFLPAIINRETAYHYTESYVCVWGQTLPSVLRASHTLGGVQRKLISPILRFREGDSGIIEALAMSLARFGVSRRAVRDSLRHAQEAQDSFVSSLHSAGREALETLQAHDRHGIILVGRPYNIYDRRVNLDVVSKLRDYYGSDVIPLDFLDLDSEDVRDINANMYWSYGRKIIAAAKQTALSQLSVIYLTNFKCGPDSFIKHYVFEAGGKPFLTLQFDGHANDAGILTRCEAFLESKGILRSWSESAEKPSSIEPEAA